MVMLVKVRTSVLIEKEILKKAQEYGLNVSQCLENALRLYINAIENANKQIAENQTASIEREVSEPRGSDKKVDRAGFEPATSRVQVGRSYQLNYRPILNFH